MTGALLGEDDDFAVVMAGEGETYARLAQAFYGDAQLAWRIEDANPGRALNVGDEVVIPKRENNRIGVWADGYQTVPILSYHRFGDNKGRISVTREQFEQQMDYLADNGFHVVSLADAAAFLRGEKALPRKSVVLTIDDGYQSVYQIAFPVLAAHGYRATVVIYSDYIGRGGLTWPQMKEMVESGLISFQPHSQSHADLTVRQPDERVDDYLRRLAGEVENPGRVLNKRLPEPVFGYAYPYGAVNRPVVDQLQRNGYQLGATVKRGANPAFAFPYDLKRTMIYKADTLDDFAAALINFQHE